MRTVGYLLGFLCRLRPLQNHFGIFLITDDVSGISGSITRALSVPHDQVEAAPDGHFVPLAGTTLTWSLLSTEGSPVQT